MSVVSLQGVSKRFEPPPAPWRRLALLPRQEGVVALRDVSLQVERGEVFGLVGPNGAGKTVLMKLCATLSEPTAGTVTVFGLDPVRDRRQIRSRIGMATTDERSFYWRLTCRQNLEFFARLHGIGGAAAARRIDDLLAMMDVTGLAERPYRTLSAGNRQRLAIARALLADPDLLLLDEPTRSMDPIAARNLRELVKERLRDGRRTVVYTTHNMAEVEELCDRVGVLHEGRLLACAPLDELLEAGRADVADAASKGQRRFERVFARLIGRVEEGPGDG